MNICDSCIHEKACKSQYRYDTGASTDENFGYPDFQCDVYEDKSYILRPKYRLNDYAWTFISDEKDQRKPVGVREFFICGIEYDDEGFWYLDCDYISFGEDELFATKEEAKVALNRYSEVL